MMRGRILVFLVFLSAGDPAKAQPSDDLAGPFGSVGVGVVVQPEEAGFGGGQFCCDAGAVTFGWWGDGGSFVSPRVSVRGELSAWRAFTNDLGAPRLVLENRHSGLTLSGLVAFHPRNRGAIRPAILAGFGMAVGRTTRTSQFIQFGPNGVSLLPGAVAQSTETVPAMTWGTDVQVVLASRISVVPQVRARFLWRSDVARFQHGLSRWLVEPRVGLQIEF